MSITIRSATLDDVHQMHFAAAPDYQPVRPEAFVEHLAKHAALVAFDCLGRVLGQVFYAVTGEGDEYSVYFYLLHVAPELRGQGIGSRLIDAIEEIARELGCRAVTLGVDIGNPAARALYERRGYAVFDRWTTLTYVTDPPLQITEDLMVCYLAQEAVA